MFIHIIAASWNRFSKCNFCKCSVTFHCIRFILVTIICSVCVATPSDAAFPSVSSKYAPYGKSIVIECNTDLSPPVEYSWAKFGPQMEPIYDRVSYIKIKSI
jgi:hypothetical protein